MAIALITTPNFVEGKSTPSVHDETTGKGNKESEQAEAFFDDGSLNGESLHEGEIPFPEGITEEEFDQTVLDVVDNYPVGDRPCDSKRGYNSNTFAGDAIGGAGGVMPDADGATQ